MSHWGTLGLWISENKVAVFRAFRGSTGPGIIQCYNECLDFL
jgi:hypothetical protein